MKLKPGDIVEFDCYDYHYIVGIVQVTPEGHILGFYKTQDNHVALGLFKEPENIKAYTQSYF